MVVISVVVLLVIAVAGVVLVRSRGASEPRAGSTPAPSSGATTSTSPAAQPSGGVTCTPGQEGPLRLDTEFTANDGSGQVVRYSISLPEDYYAACKQYPVLYALHGRDGNNKDFLDQALNLRRAMAAGAVEPSIIVTPDSFATGRWENRDTGPAEDNFIKRLIPYVEQTYRVKPGASYRMLVGFSMGGHGAFRFGLKFPDMFAAVWSVDGAMAPDTNDYLQYVEGRTSDDFHIISVGGQLNGSRVQTVIDALKQRGIEIPYTYQDREHEFPAFVEEDEKAGWPAMKYLEQNLGRSM